MQNKRVLVSSFACGPNWGSEVGMGWNWVVKLSKECQLTVITELGFKKDIESEIEKIKFDIAFDNVNEIVANTYSKVKELNISNEQKRKIFTDLDKYVDNGNKKFIQLNNKEIYIKAHNYYTNAYQFVIDKNLK